CLNVLLQFVEDGTDPSTVDAIVLIASLLLVVLSPPTPRIQTPPPCKSGGGLAGALINALLCVRKAEFAAVIVAAIALAAEIAPPNRSFWSKGGFANGSGSWPQFCACAVEDANPAKMRTPAANAL